MIKVFKDYTSLEFVCTINESDLEITRDIYGTYSMSISTYFDYNIVNAITPSTILDYNGDFFIIREFTKKITPSNKGYLVNIEAEHRSYILNDEKYFVLKEYEVDKKNDKGDIVYKDGLPEKEKKRDDKFGWQGSIAQVIWCITHNELHGHEFPFNITYDQDLTIPQMGDKVITEGPYQGERYVEFYVYEEMSRKQVLSMFADGIGAEVDFEGGNTIRLKKTIRKQDTVPVLSLGSGISSIEHQYAIGDEETGKNIYNIEVYNTHNLYVGDEVILFNERMGVKVRTRIVSMTWNPYLSDRAYQLILAEYKLSMEGFLYSMRNDGIYKGKIYNGVSIGANGIEIVGQNAGGDLTNRVLLNAKNMKFQKKGSDGNWIDSLYFDPVNNLYQFDGVVQADMLMGDKITTYNWGTNSGGNHIVMHKQMIYFKENELIKMAMGFLPNINNVNVPIIVMGAGDGNGNNRGYIEKEVDGMSIYYISASGIVSYLKLGNGFASLNGYTIHSTKNAISDQYLASGSNWNAKLQKMDTNGNFNNGSVNNSTISGGNLDMNKIKINALGLYTVNSSGQYNGIFVDPNYADFTIKYANNDIFKIVNNFSSIDLQAKGTTFLYTSGVNTYAQGNWNFSGATVSGLTAVFG